MIISIKSNLRNDEKYYCLKKQNHTEIAHPPSFKKKHTAYLEQYIIKFDYNITELSGIKQNEINNKIARIIKKQKELHHKKQQTLLKEFSNFNDKLPKAQNEYLGSTFLKLEKEMILNQLLNTLKHEITNPISGLSLATEYLKEVSDSKEIAEEIRKSTMKIKKLIKPTVEQNFINIFHTTKRILLKNYQLFHKKIKFEITGQKNLVIQKPTSQINQILENIVQNGFESASETEDGYVMCNIEQRNNDFFIHVIDNGRFPSDPTKLFSPFYTTKKNGTGLGLYITKLLCDDLGLNIKYNANDSKGFIIHGKI